MMCMLFCAASYQNASVHTCTLISCSVSHHPDGVTGNRRGGAGADPGKKKGGGGTIHCFFRTAASLESRASPKKADERGGGGGGGALRHFVFRSATSVESRASPKWGGGGNPTHFFLGFKRGGGAHVQKRGGANIQKGFKRGGGGTGRVCPPPPQIRHWQGVWSQIL